MQIGQFPPWWRHQLKENALSLWPPYRRRSIITWLSVHASVCFVPARVSGCVKKRWGGGQRTDRRHDVYIRSVYWDCASMQPHCDTHHMSNLVPFIISLYSQRAHLACHYQRSLLFPSTCAWDPNETSMSTKDNSAILVNPIVYTIVKTYDAEIIPISDV